MFDYKFSSCTDEARFYIKRLLSDGNSHSCREIKDFVRATPNGSTFPEGSINSAIHTLVESHDCERVRRSMYRAKRKNPISNVDYLDKKVNEILDETTKRIVKLYTLNNQSISEITYKINQQVKYSV